MQPEDWSHGYITDQLYTDGFYRELSPAWMNYVAALNGCHPRPIAGALPPACEVEKKTGSMWSKSRSSRMRCRSTDPTMPRQPTIPTLSMAIV